jgi:hypothetical protein
MLGRVENKLFSFPRRIRILASPLLPTEALSIFLVIVQIYGLSTFPSLLFALWKTAHLLLLAALKLQSQTRRIAHFVEKFSILIVFRFSLGSKLKSPPSDKILLWRSLVAAAVQRETRCKYDYTV